MFGVGMHRVVYRFWCTFICFNSCTNIISLKKIKNKREEKIHKLKKDRTIVIFLKVLQQLRLGIVII